MNKSFEHILAGVTILIFNYGKILSQDIVSLQPLFTDDSIETVNSVEGSWKMDFFGIDTVEFQKTGENFYRVSLFSQNAPEFFEGVFTRIGQDLWLDLLPLIEDSLLKGNQRDNLIMTHNIFHVLLQGDSMRISNINYKWFYHNIIEKKIRIYSWAGSKPVLTGTTDEIRQFISTNASDSGFFNGDLILTRMEWGKTGHTLPSSDQPGIAGETGSINSRYPVNPEFPYRDGWLGADGDLSVPVAPGKVLWIFSDSFVGKKDQVTRPGSNMVSNTVAVMTVQPEGKTTINYYWRNAYTDHPDAIFRSFTDRYRYWPSDAFMIGNNLYVVLQKTGPKPEADPNDIFNFTLKGQALAKITDPLSATPDQWEIQLMPWPHITEDNEWRCGVRDKEYFYFLVRAGDHGESFGRFPLANIENPESHVEYLTSTGEWKTSVRIEQRKVLFTGDFGNSISYYENIKKWVMVIGPGFMNNKIRIRTAPSIIGPWSEEKSVYECPESTPGTSRYDSDNFCYLGRAHVEFYDSGKHELLITYDCNSGDFSKLVDNPGIYCPRVIRVRITGN